MWLKKFLSRIISQRLFLPLVLSTLLLSQSPSLANPLQEEVVKTAQKYTYVREKTGKNDGPEIKQWLGYFGLPQGNPYCAAFVIGGCYKEASDTLGIAQPLPKTARVSTLYKTAKKNPYKFKVISAARVKQGIETLEKADVPAWSHNKLPGNSDWNGHTGIVLNQINNNTFTSIEANTSSGNKGSQRDGDGVFKRTRTLGIGTKFPVEGFIRVKYD